MIRVWTRFPVLSTALMGLALLLASCATPPQEISRAPSPVAGAKPHAAAGALAPRPAHPGGAHVPPLPATAAGATPYVALLLPLTGPQAGAAETVRDGFFTAYYVSPTAGRPRIRLYDTGSMSVEEAVQDALRGGATFVVGPLTKDAVAAAAQLPAPRLPELALNFLPAGSEAPPAFYQFALSPEAEARAVARRILADGNRRGVALAPDGEWGSRVLAAFRDALTAGGGTLLAATRYDPLDTSYASAISDVLGLDESTARYRRVRSIVGGRLAFQPRRRGDIDFIFAAGSAATARLLKPQLDYLFAGNLPTYATSAAYEPNPTANEDLEGLEFPDMPWMLGSGLADSVRLAASAAWPVAGPSRDRLFAFGFDAYRLLIALGGAPGSAPQPPASISIEGLTGQVLTIDASGHVHRDLEWARMHDGQPQLIPPPAPQPQSQSQPQPQSQPQSQSQSQPQPQSQSQSQPQSQPAAPAHPPEALGAAH